METTDMTKLVEALRSGKQAHEDGVMVIVSRQVCEEAAAKLRDCGKLRPDLNGYQPSIGLNGKPNITLDCLKPRRTNSIWRSWVKLLIGGSNEA